MSKNVVNKIDKLVSVKHALISVSDKTGLEEFIPQLIDICPEITICSTGGTYNTIKKILGERAFGVLIQVSDYTGQPELQGGLVKTLDFKIYLGLLSETYNEAHIKDMKRTEADSIDLVIANLYPFKETIAKPDVTPELARGNIDIGGPCMIRAAAKNFIRVASVVDPSDYPSLLAELKKNDGKLSLQKRFELAQKAFKHTSEYDQTISGYLGTKKFEEVSSCYQII